jgi:hypothetical protein
VVGNKVGDKVGDKVGNEVGEVGKVRWVRRVR